MEVNEGLKVGRVIEISTAIALIGDNDFLDGVVASRCGRLANRFMGVVKEYNKSKEKIQKEGRERQKALLEKMKEIGTDEAKRECSQQIQDISIEVQEKISALEEDNAEVDPKFPDLKLSDFIAKSDINREQNGEKIYIKTGQSLVTVKFFVLMGDLIKDDKNS